MNVNTIIQNQIAEVKDKTKQFWMVWVLTKIEQIDERTQYEIFLYP